jgi:hypothetical protein
VKKLPAAAKYAAALVPSLGLFALACLWAPEAVPAALITVVVCFAVGATAGWLLG